MDKSLNKIIHIGTKRVKNRSPIYLFLRQLESGHYGWFEEEELGKEKETDITGSTIEEAISLARRHWKSEDFRTLNCGFRYTLPERDEHGVNALYHQMVVSYSSLNGVYFDEEAGHNCIVSFASDEARNLWKRLENKSVLV